MRGTLLCVVLAWAFSAVPARGQCTVAWAHELPPNNFNASVFAVTVWDQDGPGGQAPVLVAAGDFTMVGTTSVSRIARWNGSAWVPMGDGLSGPVRSLTVHDDEVIAGGDFVNSGTLRVGHVAAWNGAAWRALGTGLPDVASVRSVASLNGTLFVAGGFAQAGGVNATNIAQWSNTSQSWSAVGGGLIPVVDSLGVYQGNLVATLAVSAINPSNIWTWNGGTWTALASPGTNGPIYATLGDGDTLYLTGGFTMAGGTPAAKIATWHPVQGWQTLGAGLGGTLGNSLLRYRGDIVVGGQFTVAGGDSIPAVAGWNGSGFFAFGTPPNNSLGTRVYSLVEHAGQLVAAGSLVYSNVTTGMARWTPDCPCPVDVDGNGQVQPADIALFVSVWFASVQAGNLAGDFDGNGVVNPGDVAVFVNSWFGALNGGC